MSPAITETFAWTLVHFVWQGAAIALAAGVVTWALHRGSARARYGIFCLALSSMALAPVMTYAVLRNERRAPAVVASTVVATPLATTAPPGPVEPPEPEEWLPWLVRFWLAGVSVLTMRSTGGWILAQRLKRWKTSPAAATIQQVGARLSARLGLRRAARILESVATDVPLAIGWLRPVVLLPVSALTALTLEQIEMVLAHELAHIRRHDYLVNLAQTFVETMLFYHPAVWWVSGRIRAEREHCCDDLAVQACGDVMGYVRALAALEGTAGRRTALVVAADGGSLLERITRLLDRDRRHRHAPPAWFVALVPAALIVAALSVAPPIAAGPAATPPGGFLAGLADAGLTTISVDEIIALKEHGVEPSFVKAMLGAGLGPLDVSRLIRLREHGVEPAFAASVVRSGLVSDLDDATVIRLHEHGVDGDELARIRKLGFGPYSAEEVVTLRDNGVTADRIRAMKAQGFGDLELEQIVKLCRAGII